MWLPLAVPVLAFYPAYRRIVHASRKERAPMREVSPYTHPIRVADLPAHKPTGFLLTPDAGARKRIARELSVSALHKLRFEGRIAPAGKSGWRLDGRLGATVVQSCVVTLDPLTTRIDVPLTRRYVPESARPLTGSEAEMDGDDNIEPLNEIIDLGQTMVEALALALPDYPRTRGVVFSEAAFTTPGRKTTIEEESKPFAPLAILRDKLGKDG